MTDQGPILARIEGTNIDPRSLLSTDYFNHFNTVIMLFGMLPDAADLLDEIDAWQYIDYVKHFQESGLDFAPLAIEAYAAAAPKTRQAFDKKIDEIRTFIEMSRLGMRQLLENGETDRFKHMAIRVSRHLQQLVDDGGAIVHGSEATMDQGAVNALFD